MPLQVIADAKATKDLYSYSLEELMEIPIVTATKNNQKASKSPAIVSVITKEDIFSWGYQSVAEALQQVPGLYGIDDHVGVNYGVRGINGGQRAYNRILKVMINGTAVPFRSDGSNFLGPELIPIDIVDKIEVIRGPASALYGENAFLGVVNIITKKQQGSLNSLGVRLGDGDNSAVSASFSNTFNNGSFLIAANAQRFNNDGLSVPTSSPRYENYLGITSNNSKASPKSFYGQVNWSSDAWQQQLLLSYSHLDSVAEFLDFGILSHENRVALNNSIVNYQVDWQQNDFWQHKISLSYSEGAPSNQERLSLGGTTNFPSREFGFKAYDISMEAFFQPKVSSSYVFGFDYSNDRESLIEIYSIDRLNGEKILLSSPQQQVELSNRGFFIQYIKDLSQDSKLTVNARSDRHRLFGTNNNYRLGLVHDFSASISGKFLLGTSYKAPAAMQLYSQPLYPGEVVGNETLKPEEANTIESEISWVLNEELAVNFNLWINEIENKVELLPSGPNTKPINTGKQKGKGFESELKWVTANQSVFANLAYQKTNDETNTLFQGTLTNPTASYPRLSSFIRWKYAVNDASSVGLSFKYASQRRASNSNIRENLLQPYELDSYSLFNFSYYVVWDNLSLQLKIDNLFDKDYAEPGFGGIDIPASARQWSAILRYEL